MKFEIDIEVQTIARQFTSLPTQVGTWTLNPPLQNQELVQKPISTSISIFESRELAYRHTSISNSTFQIRQLCSVVYKPTSTSNSTFQSRTTSLEAYILHISKARTSLEAYIDFKFHVSQSRTTTAITQGATARMRRIEIWCSTVKKMTHKKVNEYEGDRNRAPALASQLASQLYLQYIPFVIFEIR